MATIAQIVAQIRTAIYGKDVRENIAQGIEKCYEDSTANAQIQAIINKGQETLDSIPEDYTALTGEVDDLKSALTKYTGNEEIQFTDPADKKYINTSGDTTDFSVSVASLSEYKYAVVDCEAGDYFVINGVGGAGGRLWAFTDDSSPANVLTPKAASGERGTDLVIKAPSGAKKLVINIIGDGYAIKNRLLVNRVSELEKGIISAEPFEGYNLKNGVALTSNNGKEYTPASGADVSDVTGFIAVNPGDIVYISGKGASSVGGSGYNANKDTGVGNVVDLWSSSADSLYTVDGGIADNLKITIPNGVYFIRTCTRDNVNYPIKVIIDYKEAKVIGDIVKDTEKIADPDILFHRLSSTQFELHIKDVESGKYLIHPIRRLTYTKDMTQYGGSANMLSGDVWSPAAITTEQGTEILAGNLNFIYQVDENVSGFENENLHVGPQHGCEILDWFEFYADGKKIDISQSVDDTPCSTFRIIQKSYCYAPDRSISSTDNENYLKLDNGEKILTATHFIDCCYYENNKIEWRNALVFHRDHIKFSQLHGGMLDGRTTQITNVVINDAKISKNTITYGTNPVTLTPVGDSYNLTYNKKDADEGIQYGAGIIVRQRMMQDDGSRSKKSNIFSVAYNEDVKFYFMPAVCSVLGSTASAEEFNSGDSISVTNIREIKCSIS